MQRAYEPSVPIPMCHECAAVPVPPECSVFRARRPLSVVKSGERCPIALFGAGYYFVLSYMYIR